MINFLKNFGYFLLAVLMGIQTASADRPIITLSVGSPYSPKNGDICGRAYLIKIFDSGHVEYQGIRKVLVHGKAEYQMDKKTLNALIKKFQKANFMANDNLAWLPMMIRENRDMASIGIRFRQGNQEATMLSGWFDRPLADLKYGIIQATKAEQWGVSEVWSCSSPRSYIK